MAGTHAHRDYDAILALGSNVGDKAANLARAIAELTAGRDIRVVRRSRDYRTPPWGKTDQDWFLNACIAVETSLTPHALLDRCREVERVMGRVRAERWGPRIIDVDILVFGDVTSADAGLTIPHPRIAERAFVLVPLAEIAPDLEIGGRPVRDLLADVDTAGVTPAPEST
jgi:2-amino-4-hydroxy-6-hydroxymethyldihydropteridine diphosphokinase